MIVAFRQATLPWLLCPLTAQFVGLAPPAAGYRNGPEHFIHAIRTRTPFVELCSAETGLAAQEILTAGLKSDRSGRRVTL